MATASTVSQILDPTNPTILQVVTASEFQKTFALSLLLNFALFFSLIAIKPKTFGATKARAWILTLFSSSTVVLGCSNFFLVYLSMPKNSNLAAFPLLDSPWARTISTFFIASLISDLILGLIYYPSYVKLLTGWIHHTLYICITLNLLSLKVAGGLFLFASQLEIPTMLLALGSISTRWRSDLYFGVSFFLTRILLHLHIIYQCFVSYPGTFWVLPLIPFPIHILWFSSWFKSFSKKHKVKKVTPPATPYLGGKEALSSGEERKGLLTPPPSS